MRIVMSSRRWVASILMVGLLVGALTLVCTEGIHLPFSAPIDGNCAIVTHSGIGFATLGSESSQTLVPQLALLAAGLFAFAILFEAPARRVPVVVSPSPPPDPRFGRFRI